jgi:hypothetical protein
MSTNGNLALKGIPSIADTTYRPVLDIGG